MSPLNWPALQWLLGVRRQNLPADSEAHLVWTNQPQSWRVFAVGLGILAAAYFVGWVYRHDARQLTAFRRRLLAGLRISVLVGLAILALGPALSTTRQQVLEPVVVLLRDASQSMALPERLGGARSLEVAARPAPNPTSGTVLSRAETVDRLLASPQPLVSTLEQRGRLRVLDFAESVHPVALKDAGRDAADVTSEDAPSSSGGRLPDLLPTGSGTNLHQAVSEALTEKMLAAIVLFTDGQHTDRATGKDDLLALAARAREREIPLLVVGLGAPDRPRNIAVTDVYADPRVWKDEPFELQAVIHSEGFGQQTVHAELVERRLDESASGDVQEQVLETRDIELPSAGGIVRVPFTQTPTVAGRFSYTVRVLPVDGESSIADNQPAAPAEIKVIDEKARVLLVAGCAHWDYRFLHQLLEREPSIDLSCWLQTLDKERGQEGDTPITHLPRVREELFQYDVILLLDPDPREFDDGWLSLLDEFVRDHSGGLLYMAGPVFTSRFLSGPQTAQVRELLPVRFGDVAATDVASLLQSDDRDWELGVVETSLDHPLMRFEPDLRRSLEAWKLLPGIVWSYPVRDVVPTSSVLIEHTDPALMQAAGPRPLLVTGHYGSGRTVFVGFEGTWRWRQAGHNAEYFNRFWLQTVRFLVEGRSIEGKRRGMIETDRTRYEVGDRMLVVARLNDAAFKPLQAPEITARLQGPTGTPAPLTLRPVTDQPGRYEASAIALQTGRHILAIDLPDAPQGSAPSIETAVTVSAPSMETERTWQDRPLLQELAQASGGQYFTAESAGDLPRFVPDKRETVAIQSRPVPLWDTGRVLFLIVLLMSAEWALRKKFKLL